MPELMKVRCVCGWETIGDEPEVVEATREHGQRVHNMTATRDEILAMAVPVAGTAGSSRTGPTTPAA
jgi:hypothetical protein